MALEKIVWLVMAFGLFNLVSCGNSSSGSKSAQRAVTDQLQDDGQGTYQAVLKPMNGSLGSGSGKIIFRMNGDTFAVEEAVTGGPANVKHLQFVMAGTHCPTKDDNSDGIIDIKEAMNVSGKALIPLDMNLDSQLEGMGYGPIANGKGDFVYRRTSSVTRLVADLMMDDPDPFDDLVKLQPTEYFTLKGKVVMVLGANSELPATVAAFGENSSRDSVPVLCGELTRVSDDVGSLPTSTVDIGGDN